MNITSSEATDLMNMVNQITPYGTLDYNQTGQQTLTVPTYDANGNATGQTVSYNVPTYTATQSYSPAGQQLLDYQMAAQLNTGQAAQNLSGQLSNEFAQPITLPTAPTLPNAPNLPSTPDLSNQGIQNQLYSEYAPRVQYQQSQQAQQLAAQLQAQGITPGTPAYNNAMNLQNQSFNDQWNQMFLTGQTQAVGEMQTNYQNQYNTVEQNYQNQLGLAQQNYQNQMQNAMTSYDFPLQALGTLLGTSAPTAPTFGQTPTTTIAPANYEGDVQSTYADQMSAYNAQMQQQNSMMGGLFSLGGTLGSALMMSDERAKTGVNSNEPQQVGELDNDLPVYLYRYKAGGPPQVGVMAQDVEKVHPDAVKTIGGMRFVDYRKAVA